MPPELFNHRKRSARPWALHLQMHSGFIEHCIQKLSRLSNAEKRSRVDKHEDLQKDCNEKNCNLNFP